MKHVKAEIEVDVVEGGINVTVGGQTKFKALELFTPRHLAWISYMEAFSLIDAQLQAQFATQEGARPPVIVAEADPNAPLDVFLLADWWDQRRVAEGRPDTSRCGAELRRALPSTLAAPSQPPPPPPLPRTKSGLDLGKMRSSKRKDGEG